MLISGDRKKLYFYCLLISDKPTHVQKLIIIYSFRGLKQWSPSWCYISLEIVSFWTESKISQWAAVCSYPLNRMVSVAASSSFLSPFAVLHNEGSVYVLLLGCVCLVHLYPSSACGAPFTAHNDHSVNTELNSSLLLSHVRFIFLGYWDSAGEWSRISKRTITGSARPNCRAESS